MEEEFSRQQQQDRPRPLLPPRRAKGVLSIPSCATLGQALRDLAAADVLAAPAVDATTGDYVGFISAGDILKQLLRALYPALLNPDFVSEGDVEAYLSEAGDPEARFNTMCNHALHAPALVTVSWL